MRGLVRVLAGLVGVSGAAAVLAGAGTAVHVGSDDTLTIGVGRVSTDGPAVATAPGLLSVFGPTLVVQATSPAGDELWLGVAHQSDSNSYLGDHEHLEVTGLELDADLNVRASKGSTAAVPAPGNLDWWLADASAPRPELDWPLADGRYGVALLRADGAPGLDAEL